LAYVTYCRSVYRLSIKYTFQWVSLLTVSVQEHGRGLFSVNLQSPFPCLTFNVLETILYPEGFTLKLVCELGGVRTQWQAMDLQNKVVAASSSGATYWITAVCTLSLPHPPHLLLQHRGPKVRGCHFLERSVSSTSRPIYIRVC
jgi:hypothetical protein